MSRYKVTGPFKPTEKAVADEHATLAMNFDFAIGTMLFDESATNANPSGKASSLVERLRTPAEPTSRTAIWNSVA